MTQATSRTIGYTFLDGSTAQIDLGVTYTPAPPPPVKPKILVGTDALPVNLTRMPHAAYTRIYNGPGHGLSASLANVPAQVKPHVSFKDAATAAIVNPFLDKLTREIFLTKNHEPEGDLPVLDYQSGWHQLAALVTAHPNGHLVDLVEVFTLYAQVHGKTGPDGKGTRAEDMWSGAASMVGVDVYQEHSDTSYRPLRVLAARAFEIAKNLGVPLMFPEFGRQPIVGDSGHGAGLAQADDVRGADEEGVVALGFWDTGGTVLTAVQLPYVNAAVAALA
jgi:hypothetical protein